MISADKDDRFDLRKLEAGYYAVFVAGIEAGRVVLDRDVTWSYSPWRIEGDTRRQAGGVGRKYRRQDERLYGYETARSAAQACAVMNSGRVISALCRTQVDTQKSFMEE